MVGEGREVTVMRGVGATAAMGFGGGTGGSKGGSAEGLRVRGKGGEAAGERLGGWSSGSRCKTGGESDGRGCKEDED